MRRVQDYHDLHTLTAYEFIGITTLWNGVEAKDLEWRSEKELPKSRENENRDVIGVDRSIVRGEKNQLTISRPQRMNGEGASHLA